MINENFKSVIELVNAFPNEQTCINHLEQLRWNGNIISPFDSTSKVYNCAGNKYKCKNTGKYFNVRTSTLFDNSKIELKTWFLAIYLITAHKKGISSLQLSRDLNITQKTSWFLLHRIRNCFGIEPDTNEDNKLGGEGQNIAVDETFVGGKNKNRHANKKVENSQGRSFKDKTPVIGIIQNATTETIVRQHKVIPELAVTEKVVIKPAIVKCVVTVDTSSDSLQPAIEAIVKHGSVVVSDEWLGYNKVGENYEHRIVDHRAKEYVNVNGDTTNAIEGFWMLFKRSYIGIYHSMSRKHLQKYADEMSFRYNRRHISDCNRFTNLLENCEHRLTYKKLIK